MHILFYEIGHDISNILGSGTDYIVDHQTKDEQEAFRYFNQPGMTFMRRLIKDESTLKREYYNRFKGLWE